MVQRELVELARNGDREAFSALAASVVEANASTINVDLRISVAPFSPCWWVCCVAALICDWVARCQRFLIGIKSELEKLLQCHRFCESFALAFDAGGR